jgi:exosortase
MIWILLAVGVLAHSTLLWKHLHWMWNAEHFQYFPIAFIASGFLFYSKRGELFDGIVARRSISDEKVVTTTNPNSAVLSIVLGVNSLLLLTAILGDLPLVGWLSLLLFLMTMIYATYNWVGVRTVLPVLIVLLIIRPLPGTAEQSITIWMQRLASNISSRLLDMLGIIHYRQGVVLVLAEQSFMAEEACSGIRSLFSSITAIVFWGATHRYHWFRHLINVLQTILWVVVFNALRIVLVVWIEDQTDYSIANGLAHYGVGLLVFICIFGMVLSTDQLLASIVTPRNEFAPELLENKPAIPNIPWLDWLQWKSSRSSGFVWMGVFAALSLVAIRLQSVQYFVNSRESFAFLNEIAMPVSDASDVPSEIKQWKVVDFEHAVRPEQNQFGAESYVWTLSDGERKVVLSVDGIFNEYHDLWICYTNIGWRVEQVREYELADSVPKGLNDLTILRMSKNTGETGVVLFTAVDRTGKIVAPQNLLSLPQRIENSVKTIFGLHSKSALNALNFSPPVSTIQLGLQPNKSITDADEREMRELFLVVREMLRQSPRFKSQ